MASVQRQYSFGGIEILKISQMNLINLKRYAATFFYQNTYTKNKLIKFDKKARLFYQNTHTLMGRIKVDKKRFFLLKSSLFKIVKKRFFETR